MNKLTVLATMVACTFMVAAGESVVKPERQEVRHSMMGFRSTIVFYTYKELKAVLVVTIDNKDETFPVAGKLQIFDKATSDEAVKKWINNQHSDALYMDAAKPKASKTLPATFCKVVSHKQTGTSKNPGPGGGNYKNFEVQLSIQPVDINGKTKVPAFTDTVKVHVKSN